MEKLSQIYVSGTLIDSLLLELFNYSCRIIRFHSPWCYIVLLTDKTFVLHLDYRACWSDTHLRIRVSTDIRTI